MFSPLEEMLEAEKAHVEGFAPEAFADVTLQRKIFHQDEK